MNGPFEDRSRELFQESVGNVDMRIRSRLTRARHLALEAAVAANPSPWFTRLRAFTPAAGVTAAALLGAALWFGLPAAQRGGPAAEGQPSFEDLDIVAASDESSADAMDMLQNDIEFYDFADNADSSANPGPAA